MWAKPKGFTAELAHTSASNSRDSIVKMQGYYFLKSLELNRKIYTIKDIQLPWNWEGLDSHLLNEGGLYAFTNDVLPMQAGPSN